MYIIYGLAAMAVCCVIQFAVTFVLGFSVLDLALLLFFGVFFASLVVSNKIKDGLIQSGKKNTRGWLFFCVASGLITFITLYYTEFKAQIISGQVDWPGTSTFYGYLMHKLQRVNQLFLLKNRPPVEISTAGVVNYVIFVLQIACSLFGALVGCARSEKDCCKECDKCYKKKKLFLATREELKPFIKKDEICISNLDTFKEFIACHKTAKNKSEVNYEGLLMYCPGCYKARLVIRNRSYSTLERHAFMEKSVELDKQWVKELLSSNK